MEAIESYLAERDLNPVGYTWNARGQVIVKKNRRAHQALERLNNE